MLPCPGMAALGSPGGVEDTRRIPAGIPAVLSSGRLRHQAAGQGLHRLCLDICVHPRQEDTTKVRMNWNDCKIRVQ